VTTTADAASTASDVVSTNADVELTHADVALAEADKVQTGLDRIAVADDLILTNADVVLTHAHTALAETDKVQTGLDKVATNADVVSTHADVVITNADVVATNADAEATALSRIATNQDAIATAADVVATNADVITATSKSSEAFASARNAATSEDNAAARYDQFNGRYLGDKSHDPSLDNDGAALRTGALYFNDTDDVMKVYKGGSWLVAYSSLTIGDGGLTQKNFTTADNTKLDGIETGANNYSLPSGIATETYVGTQISSLVDSSPATLNTLNELALALGDDPNFATTVATNIAGKVDDSQVLTNVPAGAKFTDTTYSVGDGGLSQKNFTSADNTKLDGIANSANNYSLPSSVIHQTELSNSVTSTSTTIAANLKGVKAAYDRSWPNTTYSVGNGGLTQINFTSADHTKLNGIAASANNYSLPASVIHQTELSSSVTSTSTTIAANLKGVKAAYDRSWPNTTYSVGDGGLTQINFTSADHTKLNGIAASANNYSLPASVIHQTELSSSVSSTSTTVAANSAAVKAAYDRSWPDTTYSVGDGGLSQKNFTSAQANAIAANTAKVTNSTSASDLTSGTLPDARFPATLPAISGSNLTNLVLKDYSETKVAMAANDADLSLGNVQTKTISGAQTLTFSNPPASGSSGSFTLILTNGGSAAVTWPTSVDWPTATAPTLTAAGVDVLVFTTIDAGTTWFGIAAGIGMG
jgi:hypothetical protein